MTNLPAIDYRYAYRCVVGYRMHPTPKVHIARGISRYHGTLCGIKRVLVYVPAGFTGPLCGGCERVYKKEIMAARKEG